MQNEKNTVALYCRVGREDTEVAHMQAKMLREYAQKLGFTVYDEYVDNGASGLSPDRPAFVRMNEDIRAGQVQAVFVKDVARLYRDISLLYAWLEDMRRRGVAVHTPHGEVVNQGHVLRDAVWVGHGKKRDG